MGKLLLLLMPVALHAQMTMAIMGAGNGSFPNGYSYCKIVTTLATMAPSTLTNYPLAVIKTDPDLQQYPAGLVKNASAFDVGFGPDCSGTGAMLKWEVSYYNGTTGSLVAHVLRPSFSSSVNDTIGMYYGGPFTTFQSTASDVWVSQYKGVWHMSQNAANTSVPDSTSNAANATNAANTSTTSGAGQFATGLTYNGSSDFTSAPVDLSALDAVNVSYWMKWTTNADDDKFSVEHTVNTNLHNGFVVNQDASSPSGNVVASMSKFSGSASYRQNYWTRPSAGAWHYYSYWFDRAGLNTTVYVDGSLTTTTAQGTATAMGNYENATLYWMSRGGAALFGAGTMQEMRLSSSQISADEVTATYRNQNAPNTYISLGTRKTPDGVKTYNFLFDGDSLTTGLGVAATDTYPAQLMAALGLPGASSWNIGVAGQTVQTAATNAAANVDPLLAASPVRNVLALFSSGINDVYNGGGGGVSGATVYSRVTGYYNSRSSNWLKLCYTVGPASTVTGGMETARLALNVLIRADHSYCDVFVDYDAIPEVADTSNTTYYQADGVHPKAALYTIFVAAIKAALAPSI